MQNKKLRFNNTYDSGKLSFLMLNDEKQKRYIAICLEFDLETEGATEEEALEKINELSNLWLQNVRDNKLSEELLNKDAPEEFWDLYNELRSRDKDQKKVLDFYLDSIKVMPVFLQLRPYRSNLL